LSEAKRSLIKKYGGSEKSISRKLKDIQIGEHISKLPGRYLKCQKDHKHQKYRKNNFSGIICDETSSRSFTAWSDFNLNPGEVITITRLM